MPSSQPAAINTNPGDWVELEKQINFILKDIYAMFDLIRGMDGKVSGSTQCASLNPSSEPLKQKAGRGAKSPSASLFSVGRSSSSPSFVSSIRCGLMPATQSKMGKDRYLGPFTKNQAILRWQG